MSFAPPAIFKFPTPRLACSTCNTGRVKVRASLYLCKFPSGLTLMPPLFYRCDPARFVIMFVDHRKCALPADKLANEHVLFHPANRAHSFFHWLFLPPFLQAFIAIMAIYAKERRSAVFTLNLFHPLKFVHFCPCFGTNILQARFSKPTSAHSFPPKWQRP